MNNNTNPEDIMKKGCLDAELAEVKGHISYIEKDYIGVKEVERFDEEILNVGAAETTKQILYDEELFNNYDNANEILQDFLPIEVNERHRRDLDSINDVVIQ